MESPRWLLLSGAPRAEAVAALERARGRYSDDTRAVEKEATAISQSLQSAEALAAGASGVPSSQHCSASVSVHKYGDGESSNWNPA